MAPSVLRLVVRSPDGTRVLARPNGLAGWSLPRIAGPAPVDAAWSHELLDAARRVVGTSIEPVGEIAPGVWTVSARGRIPAAGVDWIGADELGRLGEDAVALRLLFGR